MSMKCEVKCARIAHATFYYSRKFYCCSRSSISELSSGKRKIEWKQALTRLNWYAGGSMYDSIFGKEENLRIANYTGLITLLAHSLPLSLVRLYWMWLKLLARSHTAQWIQHQFSWCAYRLPPHTQRVLSVHINSHHQKMRERERKIMTELQRYISKISATFWFYSILMWYFVYTGFIQSRLLIIVICWHGLENVHSIRIIQDHIFTIFTWVICWINIKTMLWQQRCENDETTKWSKKKPNVKMKSFRSPARVPIVHTNFRICISSSYTWFLYTSYTMWPHPDYTFTFVLRYAGLRLNFRVRYLNFEMFFLWIWSERST